MNWWSLKFEKKKKNPILGMKGSHLLELIHLTEQNLEIPSILVGYVTFLHIFWILAKCVKTVDHKFVFWLIMFHIHISDNSI